MAATKKPVEIEEEFEEESPLDSSMFGDGLTFKAAVSRPKYSGPMVSVYLPKLEDEGNGVKVDQYEHVTIANEQWEWTFYVLRGERVEVPVPVFVILHDRYPDI